MDGGEGDVVGCVHVVGIRAQRDLIEEVCKGRPLVHAAELVYGVDELVDVRLFIDGFVGIVGIHGEDAGIVDDVAHQLVGAHLRALDDQLFEEGAEGAHLLFAARVEGEFVYVQHGVVDGEFFPAGVLFERFHRLCADAALGHVDDAGDRLAVEGVVDDAQVGEQVFDLLAFVEAEAAEHLVRHVVFGKLLLVGAGERVDAHEHREVGEGIALPHQIADAAGDVQRLVLFLFRPIVVQRHFPFLVFRPKLLVAPAAVVADDGVGKLEDILCGAVIALELVDLCAGEILFEAEDVFQLCPAPAVDALVVVADGKHVAVHRGEQFYDVVLHAVGILKFVDVYVAEFAREVFEGVFVRFQKAERLGEEVVEVEGVVLFQMLAVGGVDGADVAHAALPLVVFGVLLGILPEHLGIGDVELDVFQELFVVKATLLEGLFYDGRALRFAVDGKILVVADALGVHAQDAHAHAVDGADPHALAPIDHIRKAHAHLVRRLIREGDGEDGRGAHPLFLDEVGDARGEHARFAAARAREHQHRALGIGDGL